MKFLPIHTKRCVHSNFFLHLIMICCGKVSSKSNMIESCSWDYGPKALLFNFLLEKLNTHLMLHETMEFNTVYTGVCSWCCEIAVGTKNSSLISWQVMFLKHEMSTMENFYVPTINVLERKFLAPSSHWDPLFIQRKNGLIFLSVT